ncbi:MAG: AzlD domain-containing protein [Spirochaetales bacterium]|nr:AzlD domain-containing protein [Spirochaetales bacterium]
MSIWWLLGGMFAVTYVPRVLPFLIGRELELPRWVRRWLDYFPYAALGALIFPGILTAVPDSPWLSLAAGGVAAGVALLVRNPTVVVLAAIAFLLGAQYLPGFP